MTAFPGSPYLVKGGIVLVDPETWQFKVLHGFSPGSWNRIGKVVGQKLTRLQLSEEDWAECLPFQHNSMSSQNWQTMQGWKQVESHRFE